jgi:hypothetical protein
VLVGRGVRSYREGRRPGGDHFTETVTSVAGNPQLTAGCFRTSHRNSCEITFMSSSQCGHSVLVPNNNFLTASKSACGPWDG